ncbi:MAG: VOC family protein [Fimbriimonadaceae bacterium]|nr:VOC family protein [Fimbriimonadaceae bacterium]QYK54698.1 MAG: VOC family protein [Fimbriimonadaceae bacterium]
MPRIDQAVTFLRTRDLEANGRFYRDLFGLELVLGQGGCRIYRWAGTSAFLGFCADGKAMAEPASAIVLTIVTDEVDEWHRHLSAHGVETDGPPRLNKKYQIYHFYADDPDGYRIEVQQFRDERWNP